MSVLILSLLACSPSEPDVGLAPASSSDDLIVTPDPPVGETWSYRWTADGVVQSDLVSNVVPAARTTRGERWKVTVERRVGRRTSQPGTASTVIQNGAPTVQASIVEARDGLQAVVWATDPDGDPVTVSWVWELDGAEEQENGVLPTALLVSGQEWTLRAWGDDGEGSGPEATATYVVTNQAPVLLGASITPGEPTASDLLDVEVDAYDPDGDPLTVDVSWRVDGEPLYDGAPLPEGLAPRGPWIDAVVTVSDGQTDSTSVIAPGVRLVNVVPTIEAVRVEPPALAYGVGPSCEVDGWADADGDLETIEVRWFIDSILWTASSTPAGTDLVKGQQVQCEATPVDDVEAGEPLLSAPANVLNSPPSVARVFLEPEIPSAADTVSVRFETIYDPDGDPVTLQVSWLVDGVEVAETYAGEGGDPDGDVFPGVLTRGEHLEVSARPYDGQISGVEVFAEATVANASPEVTALDLSPSPPQAGVDLVPVLTTYDADGDPVNVEIRWTIDGGNPTAAPFLPGSAVQSGALISVSATPNDGMEDGADVLLTNVTVP